ncbi:tRNA uridine-5-carboxymethylaminomethyl(34) synthesis GTPase MnmE [Sphingomonas sp. LHG3443-2]|uniref:tRNA uridine-5-carboxymethylaminomethyl(34) synthesis GTPase MnmE n=1 Tax=Sphingomonas sp. LHG3443-2 TaxID=2804639 RepID=UPI003CF18A93
MTTDTIFALSSGALPAAIAIVRVSGPLAESGVERLAGTLPEPRRAAVRRLVAANGDLIDEALILRFPAPHTATGESLVEIHLHGGRAVVARCLAELATLPGLREAEPGEFTRRAMLNGRLDLTQAEGLADLLSAETEWQRRAAMESAGGRLRQQIEKWRERVVMLSAQAEAAIDYVGDEDETGLDLAVLVADVESLVTEWRAWLARPPAEMLQQGVKVVLAGPPNSGKSSLFNALLGSDKAIVTPIAGTTRDVLEARLDLDGILLILHDTAGLHHSEDQVEQIGVERAQRASAAADLLLWLGEPTEAPTAQAVIKVHSRADERDPAPPGSVPASVRQAGGIDLLQEELMMMAKSLLPPPDHATLNRRQNRLLNQALSSLVNVSQADLLVSAEMLRQALHALDQISGRQSTDDVLDALFGRFCLGK